MSKVIVHIDLNAFFVRCEEIKDPSLEGKPVAVGGQGRGGIVSTCSYKAREYGVRSGMPMFQAQQLCPRLIIKAVDFRFYASMSSMFFKFVSSYTKLVEPASVDECYADFTDALKNVNDVELFFKNFQQQLYATTQLKCSIGIAPNKFLAKMGSDIKKPSGITIIRKRDIANILYPLPISEMFGIGKKTFPKLQNIGIKTIGDLAARCLIHDSQVIDILGKFYYVIQDWLKGNGDDTIHKESNDPKSISHSTTFDHDTNNFSLIRSMFEKLSKEVSQRAKKENKKGATIQIVVKEANFKSHNRSFSFSTPTNDWRFIFDVACRLYEENFLSMTIRLVGITLQNIKDIKYTQIQMSLFDYQEHENESSTKLLINELNRRLSKPMLIRASELEKEKKSND